MSKVVDESYGGRLFEGVVNVVDVHLTLVEQVVEDIHGLHSRRTLLLVAENQVDPFVKVGRDVVTLQSLKTGGKKSVKVMVSSILRL